MRYLGRRVYLAAVVVLASALRAGLSARRVAQLSQWLCVARRTLERWREWWLHEFVDTAFWKHARTRFMPPVDPIVLPASLLERFGGAQLGTRLMSVLRWLSPLSTLSKAR